ncbi:MAG TPA: hypothetical protein VJW51_01735 [Candidatus Acidoferrales bacterium]|nr:hypothetical protein [Candidatus Acidoferrales bacterium]
MGGASSQGWRGLGHGGPGVALGSRSLGGSSGRSFSNASSFGGSRRGTGSSLAGGSRLGGLGTTNLAGRGFANNGYRSGLGNGYGGYGRGRGYGFGRGFGSGWGWPWGWGGFPFWGFPFWNLGFYDPWWLWPDYYSYPPPVYYNYNLNYAAPPQDPYAQQPQP